MPSLSLDFARFQKPLQDGGLSTNSAIDRDNHAEKIGDFAQSYEIGNCYYCLYQGYFTCTEKVWLNKQSIFAIFEALLKDIFWIL